MADWDHEDVVAWILFALWAGSIRKWGGLGSDSKSDPVSTRACKPDVVCSSSRPPCPSPRAGALAARYRRRGHLEHRARRDDFTERHRAAFGVRFYWLIDPDDRTFEIFELDSRGRYTRVLGASKGTIEAPGCEGLAA